MYACRADITSDAYQHSAKNGNLRKALRLSTEYLKASNFRGATKLRIKGCGVFMYISATYGKRSGIPLLAYSAACHRCCNTPDSIVRCVGRQVSMSFRWAIPFTPIQLGRLDQAHHSSHLLARITPRLTTIASGRHRLRLIST